jgi:hypothetical protein
VTAADRRHAQISLIEVVIEVAEQSSSVEDTVEHRSLLLIVHAASGCTIDPVS